MIRLLDLKILFTAVAVLEFFYMALAVLTPPSLVQPLTGWVLSPDGHWLAKLLGMALGTQAIIAWVMRDSRHTGVAGALACYQIASATVDWFMWLILEDQGIFANKQAQAGAVLASLTHYLLGFLLLAATLKQSRANKIAASHGEGK